MSNFPENVNAETNRALFRKALEGFRRYISNNGICGAQQFADQAHLPLESLKAQSEESCGPSSITQNTKQFLGGSRGQFSPR